MFLPCACRFKDKLRVVGEIDGKKFKSPKELIGGGDVEWKYNFKADYKIYSWKVLEEKSMKISLMRSKTLPYGSVTLNLFHLATGPMEHNLPSLDVSLIPKCRLCEINKAPGEELRYHQIR